MVMQILRQSLHVVSVGLTGDLQNADTSHGVATCSSAAVVSALFSLTGNQDGLLKNNEEICP